MPKWVPVFFRGIAIAAICLFATGCGRSYKVIGVVIVGAQGARSTLREVSGRPGPPAGPVANATITLFHELNADGTPDRTSVWQRSVTSNADGSFELFSYATPGRKHLVGLEVSAAGHESVYITYVDFMNPDEQFFIASLAVRTDGL